MTAARSTRTGSLHAARRAFRLAALALGVAVVAGSAGLWLLARTVGDTAPVLQPGAWTPSWALSAVALPAAALGIACARRRTRAMIVLGALALPVAVDAAFFELRGLNALRDRADPDRGDAGPLCVYHWNMTMPPVKSWHDQADRFPRGRPGEHDPALIVLTNPTWHARFFDTVDTLNADRPVEAPDATETAAGWSARKHGNIGFFSRLPILDSGGFSLALPEGQAPDPGRVAFVTLRAPAPFDRALVVWCLDLPSDPELPRAKLSTLAAQRLEILVGEGRLPRPDLVVGDLNIPRRAASLRVITRPFGLRHAHETGGLGWQATWPRKGEILGIETGPLLPIDHAFVAPGVRALRYEVSDPGYSRHLAQTVWIEPDAR